MKILMIAPEPFFEPRGTPFSIKGRLKALSDLGHEVDLLTYHIGQDINLPGLIIHRNLPIPFIKSIKIGPSFAKIITDIALFFSMLKMVSRKRYDLLHCHEEAGFFGMVMSKILGIPHLYDMHSSLPQQLSNYPYTNFSLLIRVFEWLERRVIRTSSGLIAICPALEEHVRKISREVPMMMIENVPTDEDERGANGQDVIAFKEAHSLKGTSIILYAGTFEPYQGLDLLIEGADRVIRRNPKVVFLIMGGKPDQVLSCRKRVEELNLSGHFRFTGIRPPEEIPCAVSAASVLVSPRISGTNTPLKIYSYLQSGKPIVATNLLTHTQILSEDTAVLVDPRPESFADGIMSILDDPELGLKLGKNARRLFDECYDYSGYLDKTERILNRIKRI